MKAKIYNQKGKEAGTVELPESIFNVQFNADMVHEVLTSMRSNARPHVAHVKDRSEVRGGGKKPWRQKGTGRARHGSIRSPLWRGGGVTFGPTNKRNFARKINKKIKTKALYMLLSAKLRDKEILFLDHIGIEGARTKNAKEILKNISTVSGFEGLETKKRNAAVFYTSEKNPDLERSFNNFGNISTNPVSSINPVDLVTYKYIVITDPEKSIASLENKTKNKIISKF